MLENPLEDIPKVLDVIKEFGELAGFYINKGKTKMIVKNLDKQMTETLQEQSGIKVVKKVKYLGVRLSARNSNIFEDNYVKVWKDVKMDLERWGKMQLSLLGRISTIKMNVLPKMLFLFQTIPIISNMGCFKQWQREVARFIWQGKRPRIKYKILIDSRERGGFALPDLKLYYEAACLCWIKEWITLKNTRLLDLEGYGRRFGWHAYLWYDKVRVNRDFLNHCIRRSIFVTWSKYKELLERRVPQWISPMEALAQKKLNMENKWGTYRELLSFEKGGIKLKKLEDVKEWVPDWFSYHQLNDLFRKDLIQGFSDCRSEFERKLLDGNEKIISKMYGLLQEWETKDEMVKAVMTHWARDLGHNIEFAAWEKLWKKNLKFTACYTLRENYMKMMYRWYLTPDKLAKMYKNGDSSCWKCKTMEGNFFHMWWTCSKAKGYWEMTYNEILKIFKLTVPKKPEAFLLGIVGPEIPKEYFTVFMYATTAARTIYAQKWKQEEVPTKEEWLMKMMDYAEMARLTVKLREQEEKKFFEDWKCFVEYLKKHHSYIISHVGFQL